MTTRDTSVLQLWCFVTCFLAPCINYLTYLLTATLLSLPRSDMDCSRDVKFELFCNRFLNFHNCLLTDDRIDGRQSWTCGMRYIGFGWSLCSMSSI